MKKKTLAENLEKRKERIARAKEWVSKRKEALAWVALALMTAIMLTLFHLSLRWFPRSANAGNNLMNLSILILACFVMQFFWSVYRPPQPWGSGGM